MKANAVGLFGLILSSVAIGTVHSYSRAFSMAGDLILGGLFPIHVGDKRVVGECTDKINVDGVLQLEAFLHSLDLANAILNETIGVKLGAVVLDTCNSERVALFNALRFIIGDYLKKNYHLHHHSEETGQSTVTDAQAAHILATIDNETVSKFQSNVVGVVGPMSSTVTIQVANLLGIFKMPQISYAASTSTLGNRITYPYFLRTVPSDSNLAFVLLEILREWNWTYVIGAYENTNYGTQGFDEFARLVENTDVCFADRWKIDISRPNSVREIRAKLRKLNVEAKEAKAFILYVHSDVFEVIIRAAVEEGLQNRFIWIGTDGWGNRFIPQDLKPAVEGAIVSLPIQKPFESFKRYLYSKASNITECPLHFWRKNFWNSFIEECKKGDHTCQFIAATKNIQQKTKSAEFGALHTVRDAVFAFSTALERIHKEVCPGERGVCEGLKRILAQSDRSTFMDYLRNVTFSGVDGSNVSFMDGHDGLPHYSIMNYQLHVAREKYTNRSRYRWVNIGTVKANLDTIDIEKRFTFLEETSTASGARPANAVSFKSSGHRSAFHPSSSCGKACPAGYIRIYKQNKCCWTCEKCPFPKYRVNESHCDYCPSNPLTTSLNAAPRFLRPSASHDRCESVYPELTHYFDNIIVAVMAVISAAGLLLIAVTLYLFIYYSRTPIIKASGRELSLVLLFGIAVCYISVYVVASPPTVFTCAASRFLCNFGYTICYSSIFVKTNRIARIFNHNRGDNANGGSTKRFSFRRASMSFASGRKPSFSSARRMKYISPVSQLLLVGVLVCFQCIINTIWLILRPPTPTYQPRLDFERETVHVQNFCRAFKNDDVVIALIFPAFLLFSAAFYAFKTRKCPGKFNEMKYIAVTTYTTCVVWMAFFSLFFATEQIHLRVYALCAALSVNATVTLMCMFAPKLYVAVCKPQKNTKDAVMGKKETKEKTLNPNSSSNNDEEFSSVSRFDSWANNNNNNSRKLSVSSRSSVVSFENPKIDTNLNDVRKPLLKKHTAFFGEEDEQKLSGKNDYLTVPNHKRVGAEKVNEKVRTSAPVATVIWLDQLKISVIRETNDKNNNTSRRNSC